MTATTQRRSGGITFAIVLFIVAGIYNIIYGLEGLSSTHPYLAESNLPFLTLTSWAWAAIVYGIVALAAAGLLLNGHRSGAITGIVVCIWGLTYWFGALPVQPYLSLAVIIVLLLTLYVLTSHRDELT
jgi:hypothetical protein